jgi:hypothetical protein
MQLLAGAEHFGNVIFRYSELLPSQYHIDASIDVNRPRQDCDITCGLQQIELLVRVPFLLQSPEEENKTKCNWGLKCNVHCKYFGMYISDVLKFYLMFLTYSKLCLASTTHPPPTL